MDSAEDKLQELLQTHSETEIKEAQDNIDSITLTFDKKIEEKLSEIQSISEFRENSKNKIEEGLIVDYGISENSRDGYVYFDIKLPCSAEVSVFFNETDFTSDGDGTKFLHSINCTSSNFSEARASTIPISYHKSESDWKISVFYGEQSQVNKILSNKQTYKSVFSGESTLVLKQLPKPLDYSYLFVGVIPLVYTLSDPSISLLTSVLLSFVLGVIAMHISLIFLYKIRDTGLKSKTAYI